MDVFAQLEKAMEGLELSARYSNNEGLPLHLRTEGKEKIEFYKQLIRGLYSVHAR